VENIYARNYIAGGVAQKKEVQLGTPEAAMKARRLHAQKLKSERGEIIPGDKKLRKLTNWAVFPIFQNKNFSMQNFSFHF